MRRPRCLDATGNFWDNRPAVNIFKRPLPYLLLSLSLAIGGCEKPADLGRMQEETLALVRQHGKEVDLLQRRADALMSRGRNLGGDAPGIADAGRLLSEARSGLDQLRAQVTAAPTTIGTAAKSNDVAELGRASDDLIDKVEAGETIVRSNLAAVDNWLMSVENRPAAAAAPTPTAPPAGNETANPPAPVAPETGSGTAAGSAAGTVSPAPQK
jgi:glutathione S-transferase